MVITITGYTLVLGASVWWGRLCVDVEGRPNYVCISPEHFFVWLHVYLLCVGLLWGGQSKSVA